MQTAQGSYTTPGVQTPTKPECTTLICREWGWVAFRGVLAIAFGIMALVWPFATILTLAILWGAFAMVDGVSAGITSWRLYKNGVRWWPYALLALTGVIAGAVALVWPGITAIVLIFIIAFWAIVGGISQIVAAIRLRKEIEGEWLLAFAGAASLLFGTLLVWRPIPEGAVVIAWVISFYAILSGAMYLMLAFRLRQRAKT